MKYLCLALSVVLIFAACNKKPTPTLTRVDMLRTGKWKLSSGTLSMRLPNGRDTTLNYLNYLPSCYSDDYFVFNTSTAGATFTGSNKCSAADADSIEFQWALSNDYNNISFYRGFTFVWSIQESVNYIKFDTLSQSPLVIDTIHGVLDTLPGFYRTVVVLDSTWNLTFVRDSVPTFNINNAAITNFSQSSFTINFTMLSTYPDTVNHHTGVAYFYDVITSGQDTVDLPVLTMPDTFKYTLTYTNM